MKRLILALFVTLLPVQVNAFEINLNDIGKLVDAGSSLIKSYEDLTPEQEYYLGRAVAARLLNRFETVKMPKTHAYLQSIINYLVQFSSRPETFGGYHVQILKSENAGAYSAPGGYILITTTLLKNCASEDELAGVLAHEIAHISQQHGLAAIKQAHLTKAGATLGEMMMEKKGGSNYQQLQSLTKSFGASVEDIVKTLIDSGYSVSQETGADEEAASILSRAGYNPTALADIVGKIAEAESGRASGDALNLKKAFTQTHPGGEKRVVDIRQLIEQEELRINEVSQKRAKRFKKNHPVHLL
ncbi:MAG: peptidase M48 [Gammaproteobacteria bacterium]|nr:MAG: peptidase M48 [Gammaproteobacteria bacterium]